MCASEPTKNLELHFDAQKSNNKGIKTIWRMEINFKKNTHTKCVASSVFRLETEVIFHIISNPQRNGNWCFYSTITNSPASR